MLFFVGLSNGQADDECASFAELAGGGDGAGVAVGDAAADGKADAGAFVFAASMEALEHGKDFVGVFGVEADAVVLDGEFDGPRVPATILITGGRAEGLVDELGGDVDFGPASAGATGGVGI